MNPAYVFTVLGDKNGTMSTIYAEMASITLKRNQLVAADLIRYWIKANAPEVIANDEQLKLLADDLAYKMRKTGVAWHNEQYGFCLTELVE